MPVYCTAAPFMHLPQIMRKVPLNCVDTFSLITGPPPSDGWPSERTAEGEFGTIMRASSFR